MINMIKIWMLVIVALITGVWSGEWAVTFSDLCTFRGTSTLLRCSYDYPAGQRVSYHEWSKYIEERSGRYLLDRRRFEYVGDDKHDCSLKIKKVQFNDRGNYFFYFRTSRDRWLSNPPLHLTVEDLTAVVEPSTEVVEGQSVRLTCGSRCPTQKLHRFVWFRNGQRVTNANFQARGGDAGRYYCAVEGQELVQSSAVPLYVKYAPIEVKLSQSPPGDVVNGTSLTLSCSSNANPPVEEDSYSLYRDQQLISEGQRHTIITVLPSHSGQYHCRASNGISRNGQELFSSPGVDIDVRYLPMNTTAMADRADVFASSSVNLTCSSDANPPAHNYVWYKRVESAELNSSATMQRVGSGQVLTLTAVTVANSGIYLCQAWNRIGESNSTEMVLTVKEERIGTEPLPILAGIGAFILVTLLIALLLFQKKQQKHNEPKELSSGAPSTSVNEDLSAIYANVSSVAYSETPSPHKPSTRQNRHFTYEDPDVTYSAITIKPRKPPRQIKQEPQQSEYNAEESDSVIYATVNKSSEV